MHVNLRAQSKLMSPFKLLSNRHTLESFEVKTCVKHEEHC